MPSRLVIKQNDKLIVLDTKEIIFITRENRKTVDVSIPAGEARKLVMYSHYGYPN